ncbi:hypothetical protein GGR54DRAFT_583691 [Hypoxylon sp. NC1633]|nr:hypothetical protein GGR54DRAFT_583691 [Hypoxylon sp. NC1633]
MGRYLIPGLLLACLLADRRCMMPSLHKFLFLYRASTHHHQPCVWNRKISSKFHGLSFFIRLRGKTLVTWYQLHSTIPGQQWKCDLSQTSCHIPSFAINHLSR